ncbi:hypothetical protein V2P20_09175 [Methylobacter sp. Wu1]
MSIHTATPYARTVKMVKRLKRVLAASAWQARKSSNHAQMKWIYAAHASACKPYCDQRQSLRLSLYQSFQSGLIY